MTMYVLNIVSPIKRMTIKELIIFIFRSYYRRIAFPKEKSFYLIKQQKEKDLSLLVTKLIEKNT